MRNREGKDKGRESAHTLVIIQKQSTYDSHLPSYMRPLHSKLLYCTECFKEQLGSTLKPKSTI